MIGLSLSGAKPIHRRVCVEGQSNAFGVGGRNELILSPLSSDSGLATFDAAPFSRVYIFNPTSSAYEPLRMGYNQLTDTYLLGPEFGLAVRWMRETTRGNLYIDKNVQSGAAIAYFQQGAGTGFYEATVSRRAAANAWLLANGLRVAEMGLLWVQGESDNGQTQSYYQSALESMIGNKIAAGLLPANAKIILAKQLETSLQYAANIRAAQDGYIASHPSTAAGIVYPPYFNSDNLHLNARGQIQLAYDAYSLFFSRANIIA